MHFIAECGIEYGLQFVTRFFLNSLDCLYLKKSCEFLQSYEKRLTLESNYGELTQKCLQIKELAGNTKDIPCLLPMESAR